MSICVPENLPVQAPVPASEARLRGDRDGQDWGGRLVPALPPGSEH